METIESIWKQEKPKKSRFGKFILIDNTNRFKLEEGRDFGMGFGFAKREEQILTMAYPISPCRDYLNDQVYSEITGKPYHAYGCHSTKQDLFDKNFGYLVFGICKQGKRESYEYGNYRRDYDALQTNYKNLQQFINWFEEQFKLDKKTKIVALEENRFVAIMPIFWGQATYRISLYSLLLRTGFLWKNENYLDYLRQFNYDGSDAYLARIAADKVEKMIAGNIPTQDLMNISNVHNMGINGFKF